MHVMDDAERDRLERIEAVLPGRWDTAALRSGASVCLTLVLPFRLLAVLIDSQSSAVNFVLFALFLSFFEVGAGCAAWVQRVGFPLSHALATAAASYVIAELLFIVIRLIRGSEIPWMGILITFSFVALCGLVGGVLGSRLQAQGFVPSSQRR